MQARSTRAWVGYLLVFAAAAFVGRTWDSSPFGALFSSSVNSDLLGGYGLDTGTELVFVYIGSPECGYCLRPELQRAVNAARKRIKERASADSARFVSHGVSVSWDVESGYQHLTSLGGFDEMSLGRNWFNLGAERYLWDKFPGVASTPQVLVIRRKATSPFAADSLAPYSLTKSRLLVRKVGAFEIQDWNAIGAPLPRDEEEGSESGSA